MSTVHHPSNFNSCHHHEQVDIDYNENAEEEIFISLQLGGPATEGSPKQRSRGKSPTGSSCLLGNDDNDDEADAADDENHRPAKSISVPRRVSSCTVSSMPLLDDDSEEDTDEELQYYPRRLTRPKYDRSRLLSPNRSARIFDRYRPKNATTHSSRRSSRRNSSTATCHQRRYSHLSSHARDLLLDNGESFQAQLQALRECAGQSSEESDLGGSSSDFELSEDEGLAIANAAQRLLKNTGKKRDTGSNRRATCLLSDCIYYCGDGSSLLAVGLSTFFSLVGMSASLGMTDSKRKKGGTRHRDPIFADLTEKDVENDNLEVLLSQVSDYLASTQIPQRNSTGKSLAATSKATYLNRIWEAFRANAPVISGREGPDGGSRAGEFVI